MMQLLKSLLLEHAIELLSAVLAYIAARYILELSTPEEDMATIERWRIWRLELRWYRGPEYLHQIRGARILAQL